MSHFKVGRNDPCPCGSGKKYKRCCLPADQHRARVALNVPSGASPEPGGQTPPPRIYTAGGISRALRQLQAQPGGGGDGKLADLVATAETLDRYVERQDEIRAAEKVLEACRSEYERLLEDEEAVVERSSALFAEERFARFRFTVEEVRRAAKEVGLVPPLTPDDRGVEKLRSAILKLADKERRTYLSMGLLLELPALVAAGRLMDAWLLVDAVDATSDQPNESNPFLFHMFGFGFDAWQAELRAADEARFRELGFDPERLRTMSFEEIEAWLAEQEADPARRARLEAILATDPAEKERLARQWAQNQRDSAQLLARPDATHLLLTAAEVQPWIPRTLAALESASLPDAPSQDSEAQQAAMEAKLDAVRPVIGEMARAVFTRERRRQLAAELRQYRQTRFEAGEKQVSLWAQMALSDVEGATEPEESVFLTALCLRSLAIGETPPGANEDLSKATPEPEGRPESVPPRGLPVQQEFPSFGSSLPPEVP